MDINNNPFGVIIGDLREIKERLTRLEFSAPSIPPIPERGGVDFAYKVLEGRLSKSRIYALASEKDSRKRIPCARRGNRLWFNRTELLEWIAAGTKAAR